MGKLCLISLMGLFLSGCDDYPGKLPGSAVKMTANPLWSDSIGDEIAIGGDCHIDSINNEPGEGPQSHTVMQNGAAMKVAGWGAISAKDGVVAAHIAIALKSKSVHGTRLFAAATQGKRLDVAEYFKNPASVDSGFSASIDLSDVPPGEYVLEVIQQGEGKNYKCQWTSVLNIEK